MYHPLRWQSSEVLWQPFNPLLQIHCSAHMAWAGRLRSPVGSQLVAGLTDLTRRPTVSRFGSEGGESTTQWNYATADGSVCAWLLWMGAMTFSLLYNLNLTNTFLLYTKSRTCDHYWRGNSLSSLASLQLAKKRSQPFEYSPTYQEKTHVLVSPPFLYYNSCWLVLWSPEGQLGQGPFTPRIRLAQL